jgi:hypothetical protein
MSKLNGACESLIVTTSQGDYYVIPAAALEQFHATAPQRQQIDAAASDLAPNFAARRNAAEASAQSSFASTNKPGLLASFLSL